MTEDEQEVERCLLGWVGAMRFRSRATAALQPLGLTFALFRVLQVTWRLQRELNDAVIQLDVARACSLGKSSVCELMRELERRHLVDISYDQWGYAQRIDVSNLGGSVVVGAHTAVAIAARDP